MILAFLGVSIMRAKHEQVEYGLCSAGKMIKTLLVFFIEILFPIIPKQKQILPMIFFNF